MTTEDERATAISNVAAEWLQTWILALEQGTMSSDEMLGMASAAIAVVHMLGYPAELLTQEAIASAERLLEVIRSVEKDGLPLTEDLV